MTLGAGVPLPNGLMLQGMQQQQQALQHALEQAELSRQPKQQQVQQEQQRLERKRSHSPVSLLVSGKRERGSAEVMEAPGPRKMTPPQMALLIDRILERSKDPVAVSRVCLSWLNFAVFCCILLLCLIRSLCDRCLLWLSLLCSLMLIF
jgi:hypothetical protein